MHARVRFRVLACTCLLGIALAACEDNGQSAVHPGGPAAARIAELWWIMLAGAGLVFVLVLVVLVRAFRHRGPRAQPRQTDLDDRGATRWIVAGGVGLPVLMLVPLLVYTLSVLGRVAPPRGAASLLVEITGLQWWWKVRYLDREGNELLRSANEIRIPVGHPVRIRLRSEDVIHSFWVPGIHGKMDLVPGKTNQIWIQADRAGTYRGECAEYCGLQHARMQFRVVALPEEEFAGWIAAERRPAEAPNDSLGLAGREVFQRAGCALCHRVRGTEALGAVAPDLTHVASRLTLAAGTLPNTRGHLAGWVANPQALKPGNRMPRVPLTPEELHAVLHYLASLR